MVKAVMTVTKTVVQVIMGVVMVIKIRGRDRSSLLLAMALAFRLI